MPLHCEGTNARIQTPDSKAVNIFYQPGYREPPMVNGQTKINSPEKRQKFFAGCLDVVPFCGMCAK